jgi:hypothetical protein
MHTIVEFPDGDPQACDDLFASAEAAAVAPSQKAAGRYPLRFAQHGGRFS